MNFKRLLLARTPLITLLRIPTRHRGRVLLYHRVVDESCHPCILEYMGTAVTKAVFEQHLDHLARYYRVVDLATMMAAGDRATNMLAITFDDGYADNLRNAMPMLKQRGLPATVFAVGGFVGTNTRGWWDRLARLVADHGNKPLTLDAGGGVTKHFEYPGSGKKLFAQAHGWMDGLTPAQRDAVFAGRFVSDDDRFLDVNEMKELERNGVRIEAHTMTHPRLSTLNEAETRDELTRSRAVLAEMVGHSIDYLAYPFGGPSDFTESTKRIAKEAGYRGAFAAYSGLIGSRSDRFELPRLGTPEDMDRFRIKLARPRI